jgi:DNA-binding IclR family transcriptional regulator
MPLSEFKIPYEKTDPVAIAPLPEYSYDAARVALSEVLTAIGGLDFVKKELNSLVMRFDETCYFGILEGADVLYIEKSESTNPLRMLVDTGRRLPAYATGIGKALLVGKSEDELRALYPQGLRPLTERTVTDINKLSEELKAARLSGYVEEIEESTAHIRCYGAPIMKSGNVIAAISIAIPTFRFNSDKGHDIRLALTASAKRIGDALEKTNTHLEEII